MHNITTFAASDMIYSDTVLLSSDYYWDLMKQFIPHRATKRIINSKIYEPGTNQVTLTIFHYLRSTNMHALYWWYLLFWIIDAYDN